MSKHKLTYLDMYPEALPVEPEPGPLAIVLGALFACAAVYLLTVVLFSL